MKASCPDCNANVIIISHPKLGRILVENTQYFYKFILHKCPEEINIEVEVKSDPNKNQR